MDTAELKKAMEARHSVRAYLDKPIEAELCERLRETTETCNREGGLHFQLVTGEPKAFGGLMAHYGKFSGVKNYVALIGKKSGDLQEKVGYYGERVALTAQALGLNTCWVALTYKKVKTAYTVGKGEKLCCVLALGYGETQGVPHKSKSAEEVSAAEDPPAWFAEGVRAALLAPTAMNQQKFRFALRGDTVEAATGKGFYAKIDLGIAKLHFELGAGKENFRWA